MQQLVFRVERPYSGDSVAGVTGPYASIFFQGHDMKETHPSPYADEDADGRTLTISDDEYCALDSMRSVEAWFEGYGKKLSDAGYKLVALSLDEQHIRRGRMQVVVKRKYAKVIHEMDPLVHISTKEELNG